MYHGLPSGGDLTAPHLRCYDIAPPPAPTPTPAPPIKAVNLLTQFGLEESVRVGQAKLLCTPADKEVYPGPLPVPPDPTDPHYKCYEISPAVGVTPTPITSVELETQFNVGPQPIVVDLPKYLCVPAIKTLLVAPPPTPVGTQEGTLDAPDLKCYTIKVPQPTPDPTFVGRVQTEFGVEGPEQVQQEELVCVPALIASAVGGIAELPASAGAAAEVAGGSSSSAGDYAALAGCLAVLAIAVAAGGWYARRRLSRS
jgi:hypothetical protein